MYKLWIPKNLTKQNLDNIIEMLAFRLSCCFTVTEVTIRA